MIRGVFHSLLNTRLRLQGVVAKFSSGLSRCVAHWFGLSFVGLAGDGLWQRGVKRSAANLLSVSNNPRQKVSERFILPSQHPGIIHPRGIQ